MAETTDRMGVPYPSENQNPYYSTFESMANELDQLNFAWFNHINTIVAGGGTISWSSGTLSFTADIDIVSPTHGVKQTIPLAESGISVQSGAFLYVTLSLGPTTVSEMTDANGRLLVSTSPAVGKTTYVIGYHAPDGNFYMSNGRGIADASSITLAE